MGVFDWLLNPDRDFDRRVDARLDQTLPARLEPALRNVWDHLNAVDAHIRDIEENHTEMGIRMTAFSDQAAALYAVTNDLGAKWEAMESVNAELRAAVQNGDTARAEALAAQANEHAAIVGAGVEKLRGIGRDETNPVPDPEPLPDVTPVDPESSPA